MMRSAISVLCFTLVVMTTPSQGHRRLKHVATELLEWSEKKGGELFNEALLGNRLLNGTVVHDPMVSTDFRQFLQELVSRLEGLRDEALTEARSPAQHGSRQGHRAHRDLEVYHSQLLVLPADARLQSLDYNDILDIIGDYTKAFTATVQPMVFYLHKRDASSQADRVRVDVLVNMVLDKIKQVRALGRL